MNNINIRLSTVKLYLQDLIMSVTETESVMTTYLATRMFQPFVLSLFFSFAFFFRLGQTLVH